MLGFIGVICQLKSPAKYSSRPYPLAATVASRRFRVSSADSPSTSPLAPSSASEEEGDRSNRRWIDSPAYINYIVGLGLLVGLARSPVLLISWIIIGRGGCGGPGDGVGEAEALSFCIGPWSWLLARLCYLCCCGRFAQRRRGCGEARSNYGAAFSGIFAGFPVYADGGGISIRFFLPI